MTVLNQPKLFIISLIVLCATAGWLLGRMDAVQWAAVVGPFGGYLVGNGVASRNGQTSQPVIAPKDVEG